MNRLILLLSTVMLFSCNKSDNGNSGNNNPNNNLNSTEQKILGTWYLKKEVDSFAGTGLQTINFTKTLYVVFKSDANPAAIGGGAGEKAKVVTDAAGLYLAPFGIGREILSNSTDLWWWYDETGKVLRGTRDYTIESIGSNNLVLKHNMPGSEYAMLYFEK